MKHLLFALAALLLLGGSASAQRLMVGVRGGMNFTDYSFAQTRINDVTFVPTTSRIGFETGLVIRLNLSKHLHLQSELNYAFTNYAVRTEGVGARTLTLRTERLNIPVELGFQFGALRLFGGAQFRVAQTARSTNPGLLSVKFNDSDIALIGGVGLNIRKFFIDFRMTGYPRSHVYQQFVSNGVSQRVRVSHDIIYGGTVGFFF